MNINISQWRYSPFLMLLALWLPTDNAQADPISGVTCQAGMNTAPGSIGTVNLGTITTANANSANVTGTLNYSCTNTGDTAGFVSVCFGVDGGQHDPSNVSSTSRYMERPGFSWFNTTNRLRFTMTHSENRLLGTRSFGSGSEYKLEPFAIGANTTVTGSTTINISLTSATNNTNATKGVYTNNFGSGNRTALTAVADTNSSGANCLQPSDPGLTRFPFIVQATVLPDCTITATSNVDLIPSSAGAVNITGSNSRAITVNCTNGGAYYIGLAPSPSNGVVSDVGAGFMRGASSGNLDKVPYQLQSDGSGKVWGNTATSTSVGNGVAGIGDGKDQSLTVYVTVPSTDFKPDNYSDTVTIRVNY